MRLKLIQQSHQPGRLLDQSGIHSTIVVALSSPCPYVILTHERPVFYLANMKMPDKNVDLDIVNHMPRTSNTHGQTMWNCYKINISSATF